MIRLFEIYEYLYTHSIQNSIFMHSQKNVSALEYEIDQRTPSFNKLKTQKNESTVILLYFVRHDGGDCPSVIDFLIIFVSQLLSKNTRRLNIIRLRAWRIKICDF